ncbi:conserved hypothetical protein [Candidatus Sulfotelmatobacter kueseliae]|uniref:Uncharacterized protein n=1 Tax=Candidatus Sulfotelmatobacter kueseliae TaxID=2042962 RepID=A0A2U3LDI8_9BACT|nr:conserved hypothetical protein [Candidatus Sulfotelmatobacter kueseliae]
MPPTLDDLLTRLETAKGQFGRGAAAETKALLGQISAQDFKDAHALLRFHEALLFLRAFPQARSLVPHIERLLNTFHQRIGKIRDLGRDMSVFDDFDTSGIAGTTMQDTLNFTAARWLADRIPRNVEIAGDDYWNDYDAERAMGQTWPRFIPLLREDSDVEANIPWRSWLDAARGRERDLAWFIRRFEQLPVFDRVHPERERDELYDSLRIPIRWHLNNLKLSRTRNWIRPRQFYFHSEPLLTRSQVSLAEELAKTPPRFTRLSRREGERVMETIREVMLVRYRELYGTTLGDPRSVVRADLGRGVGMHFWNLSPSRRLPLRAYVAGFTLKNGVPINYIEAIGLGEWIEVGFNTFYTYRQGETAWIYAQALRSLRALMGATTISVYPYQIGQNNDEALDSGAFWFYRKLGFRCGRADLEQLARREEQRIAADRQYRTPRKTLKSLAEAHVFYELDRSRPSAAKAFTENRAPHRSAEALRHPKSSFSANSEAAEGTPGPWDTFSTRNLAQRVNRRMAREFGGDSVRIREASVREVSRALGINPARWTPVERRSLENWSLVLALIPGLKRWSPEEKRDLIAIIRSQSGPSEMRYLRLTQRHARLRKELLRLGS